jgi:hypothetical protein
MALKTFTHIFAHSKQASLAMPVHVRKRVPKNIMSNFDTVAILEGGKTYKERKTSLYFRICSIQMMMS